MMLRSAINIMHIPEEQVAYRQCTRPSLPPAKAWLREASLLHCLASEPSLARPDVPGGGGGGGGGWYCAPFVSKRIISVNLHKRGDEFFSRRRFYFHGDEVAVDRFIFRATIVYQATK